MTLANRSWPPYLARWVRRSSRSSTFESCVVVRTASAICDCVAVSDVGRPHVGLLEADHPQGVLEIGRDVVERRIDLRPGERLQEIVDLLPGLQAVQFEDGVVGVRFELLDVLRVERAGGDHRLRPRRPRCSRRPWRAVL